MRNRQYPRKFTVSYIDVDGIRKEIECYGLEVLEVAKSKGMCQEYLDQIGWLELEDEYENSSTPICESGVYVRRMYLGLR